MKDIILRNTNFILTNGGYVALKDLDPNKNKIAYFDKDNKLKFTNNYTVESIDHNLNTYMLDVAHICFDVPEELIDNVLFKVDYDFGNKDISVDSLVRVDISNKIYLIKDIYNLCYKFLFLSFADIDILGKHITYDKNKHIKWFNHKFFGALKFFNNLEDTYLYGESGKVNVYSPTLAIDIYSFYNEVLLKIDKVKQFLLILRKLDIIHYYKEKNLYIIISRDFKLTQLTQFMLSLFGFISYTTKREKSEEYGKNICDMYYQVNAFKRKDVGFSLQAKYTNCSCIKLNLSEEGIVPISYLSSVDRKYSNFFIKNY